MCLPLLCFFADVPRHAADHEREVACVQSFVTVAIAHLMYVTHVALKMGHARDLTPALATIRSPANNSRAALHNPAYRSEGYPQFSAPRFRHGNSLQELNP